jgi:anti-sigma regulatory factor (Ser/Thr protein kinase)
MPTAEVTLPAAVSSVPTARHFVESILRGWGMDDLGWPATLVVSELAANAALHARGDSFSIRIETREDLSIRVEVSDRSLRLPQQRTYSKEATTGRGLRLVNELATDWGVHARDDGKTVWVVLRPAETADSADEDTDADALLSAFDDVVPIQEGRDRPSARTSAGLRIAA